MSKRGPVLIVKAVINWYISDMAWLSQLILK
ncbi:hypothetical protein LFAB_15540 [Lactiplantibacillus fabifermentans T30PCM01]|uniref:Uncharacterized protein n=1 Tax=Lactiplantibacillus fabifermentans T30PCM01 TaxID=1400520 RepID=W6T489_9LACO|nr:hypothetical protein LFAB_15540 [Lactiplantibacillus fabifermentans T30PCM01]